MISFYFYHLQNTKMMNNSKLLVFNCTGMSAAQLNMIRNFSSKVTMRPISQKSAERIAKTERDWKENPRWEGIERRYSAADVERLRGSLNMDHSLARHGSERLWKMLNEGPYINALGALTGNQAMQQVKAGLKSIYVSGWQVAADANISGEMYPDQVRFNSILNFKN